MWHAAGQEELDMSKPIATFFWRKLDHPGHDSCRLLKVAQGWRLVGAAVFLEARRACHLVYDVRADAKFRTQTAAVVGYVGRRALDVRIESRASGRWHVTGTTHGKLDGCIDVDLGFTPATNLLVLRRLALGVGESAEAPAAYLSFPSMRFRSSPQHYRRIARAAYAYESPDYGYAETLRVNRFGAVIDYPRLFELVVP
jgi:uncharacterized protein